MQFKMASIAGISYGGKSNEEGEKREKCDFQIFNPEFIDPDLEFYDNRLLEHISGIIECEPPNNKLGRFNGKARVYISYNL